MATASAPFGFLLKTYRVDLDYVARLLYSFKRFNVEQLPLYLVAPDEDLSAFHVLCLKIPHTYIISESEFSDHLVKNAVNGVRAGYLNQQIIKLAFWEKNFLTNYLCLDSDVFFIRQFRKSDFMSEDEIPFVHLSNDHDLYSLPDYSEQAESRSKSLISIAQALQIDTGTPLGTVHNCVTISDAVMKSFFHDFMVPNSLNYADLLRVAPYEFNWYVFYLQKTAPKVISVDSRFKIFHSKSHVMQAIIAGQNESHFAKSYVGIGINSNLFGYGLQFGADETRVLSIIMSSRILAIALVLRLTRQIFSLKHYIIRFLRSRF